MSEGCCEDMIKLVKGSFINSFSRKNAAYLPLSQPLKRSLPLREKMIDSPDDDEDEGLKTSGWEKLSAKINKCGREGHFSCKGARELLCFCLDICIDL
jgi:hypothetical protein